MNQYIGKYSSLITKYGRGLTEKNLKTIEKNYDDICDRNEFRVDMDDSELISRATVIWGDFFNIIYHTQLPDQRGFKYILELENGNILLYAWDGEKPLNDILAWKFGFRLSTYLLEPKQVNLIVDTINNSWTNTLGNIPYINKAPRLIEDNKVGINEFVYDINKPYEKFSLDSGDEQLYDKVFSFTERWINSVNERPDIRNLRWVHIYSTVKEDNKKIHICYEGYNSYPPEMVLTFDATALTAEEYTNLGREIYNRLGGDTRGEYLTYYERGFELLNNSKKI